MSAHMNARVCVVVYTWLSSPVHAGVGNETVGAGGCWKQGTYIHV